jgi:hypothetical protein
LGSDPPNVKTPFEDGDAAWRDVRDAEPIAPGKTMPLLAAAQDEIVIAAVRGTGAGLGTNARAAWFIRFQGVRHG